MKTLELAALVMSYLTLTAFVAWIFAGLVVYLHN